MPIISCGFVNRPGRLAAVGPLVSVEIGDDPDFRPNAGRRPAIPAMRHNALVDTGSSVTGIDVELADYLNLPVRIAGCVPPPDPSIRGRYAY